MIKLNYGYFIDNNGGCYNLKKTTTIINKDTKESKMGEIVKGYYGCLEHALQGYLKHRQGELAASPEFKTLAEILELTQEVKKEITDIYTIKGEKK